VEFPAHENTMLEPSAKIAVIVRIAHLRPPGGCTTSTLSGLYVDLKSTLSDERRPARSPELQRIAHEDSARASVDHGLTAEHFRGLHPTSVRRYSLLVGLASVSLMHGIALGEPAHHIALRWTTVEGCIDETTLVSTVERVLGRPVFRSTAPTAATIDGRVAAAPRGFEASIQLVSPDGHVLATRNVVTEAESCGRLDESIAVVVALMVDGVAEPERLAPAPPKPTPLRIPPTPSAPVVTTHVLAGPSLLVGLLPSPSLGLQARAGVTLARWITVTGGFGAWAPSDAVDGPVSTHIWAWLAEGSACVAPIAARAFRLEACAFGGGGFLYAQPSGLVGPATNALSYAALGPALDGWVRLSNALWLDVRPGLMGMLARPRYFFHALDGTTTTLFQVGPVAFFVMLGVGS
jgi:hypothetical protein